MASQNEIRLNPRYLMSSTNSTESRYMGSELELFAYAKNWKAYWTSKIAPLLGNSILEVGAGVGSNFSLLWNEQHSWTAVEPDPAQCTKISEIFDAIDTSNSLKIVTGTLQDVPEQENFDSIIYIDVLEHIEDDALELSNAYKHLNQGGLVVVLSPAHQFLFSPFDKSVGHFRRYNKKTLKKLLPIGANIKQLYYLDSVGCIASWCNSKILKSGMPTRGQIWVWDSLMIPLARVLDRILSYKLGKTIVAVYEKPVTE